MRSVVFVSVALALAASAMPVGIGGELRRSDSTGVTPPNPPCLPGTGGLSNLPCLPCQPGTGDLSNLPCLPVSGDLPNLPSLPGSGGPISLISNPLPGLSDPAVGSAPALPARGVDSTGTVAGLADGQAGKLAGNAKGAASGAANTITSNPALKGAANGSTGKFTRDDKPLDLKKILTKLSATGVASKGGGAAGLVGTRDVTSNSPGVGDLSGKISDTANQLKGTVMGVVSGSPGSVTGSAPPA